MNQHCKQNILTEEGPNSKKPLVSVIVITFNSEKYVLETLESAKSQTYQNIELIISDDCSTDKTLDYCRKWLTDNKDRFINTELVTTFLNTGISGNCNRGLKASKGEWVKYIAGDDILLPECIQTYIEFTNINKNAKLVFGGIVVFYEDGKEIEKIVNKEFNTFSARKQFRFLLKNPNPILAPASLINRSKLIELNGFNEEYPQMEDLPLWIKATENSNKLFLLDNICVKYRIHDNNLSLSPNFSKAIESDFSNKTVLKLVFNNKMYFYYWHKKILIYIEKHQSTFFFKLTFIRRICLIIDPYAYYLKAKTILSAILKLLNSILILKYFLVK